jgi:hypothetical protein
MLSRGFRRLLLAYASEVNYQRRFVTWGRGVVFEAPKSPNKVPGDHDRMRFAADRTSVPAC